MIDKMIPAGYHIRRKPTKVQAGPPKWIVKAQQRKGNKT